MTANNVVSSNTGRAIRPARNQTKRTKRSVEVELDRLAAAAVASSTAASASPADPIFAAIGAPRRASAVWSDTVSVRCQMIDGGPVEGRAPIDLIERAAAIESATWEVQDGSAKALLVSLEDGK